MESEYLRLLVRSQRNYSVAVNLVNFFLGQYIYKAGRRGVAPWLKYVAEIFILKSRDGIKCSLVECAIHRQFFALEDIEEALYLHYLHWIIDPIDSQIVVQVIARVRTKHLAAAEQVGYVVSVATYTTSPAASSTAAITASAIVVGVHGNSSSSSRSAVLAAATYRIISGCSRRDILRA